MGEKIKRQEKQVIKQKKDGFCGLKGSNTKSTFVALREITSDSVKFIPFQSFGLAMT